MKFRATFAVLAFLLLWHLGSWLYQRFAPSPELHPHPDYEVVLFSIDPCRGCDQARQLLEEQQVVFFEYDLHQSEEGLRKFEALGGLAAPLVVVKGQVLHGYNRQALLQTVQTSLTRAPRD